MKTTTAPTNFELSMIAATLAHGRQDTEPHFLAYDAMKLWFECARTIADSIANAQKEPEPPQPPRFESPPVFPIKRDDALRLWLPSVTEADRMKSFRDWRKHVDIEAPKTWETRKKHGYRLGPKPEHTPIEEDLAKDWLTMLDEPQFHRVGNFFLDWREDQTRKARAKAGKKGAESRTKKK